MSSEAKRDLPDRGRPISLAFCNNGQLQPGQLAEAIGALGEWIGKPIPSPSVAAKHHKVDETVTHQEFERVMQETRKALMQSADQRQAIPEPQLENAYRLTCPAIGDDLFVSGNVEIHPVTLQEALEEAGPEMFIGLYGGDLVQNARDFGYEWLAMAYSEEVPPPEMRAQIVQAVLPVLFELRLINSMQYSSAVLSLERSCSTNVASES